MRRILPKTISWFFLSAAGMLAIGIMFFANSILYEEYIRETNEIANIVIPERGIAWIEIDFGDGSRRLFEGELNGRSYPLLVALSVAAESGNFGYKIDSGHIISIAGRRGTWKLYRNDLLTSAPLATITIAKGDHYNFRRE